VNASSRILFDVTNETVIAHSNGIREKEKLAVDEAIQFDVPRWIERLLGAVLSCLAEHQFSDR